MGIEIVTLVVGATYTGWKSMSVSAAARSPERSFEIAGAMGVDELSAATFSVKPGDVCTVLSNGTPLVVGWVNKVSISLNATDHAVKISGKSRGQDTAKCSVDHKSYEWKKKTALDIAKDIDKSGIGYTTDEALEPVDVVRGNVGDTQMQLLDKVNRKQKLFMTGSPDGGVLITRHGKHRHAGGIIEGWNFLSGTADFSDEQRMNKVKVKGHQPKGTGEKNFRYEEEAEDAGARPGLTKIIVPKTAMSRKEAKDLADHAIDNRFGDSVKLDCQVQGFRDDAGQIWTPGWLVWCEVPSCRLAMELAIDHVTFSQDEEGQGSITKLTLVEPSALGASGNSKPGKKQSKSFEGWTKR